ncbi:MULTISPECIES: hypothetical protein [Streptomyces]|uniref:WXG100 family type VII secretion target n=1 Tax=Streptomyces koyangensis TaxID=188770 RepID=A0A385D9K3_9ACTN|nr:MULTISPECIES: hypothetical protein [Streptomyces]AXQ55093.1 hypothetical protein D0C37_11070 [Streptomyces koyangensis]PKR42414.1 hypothetical protein CWE27_25690 [Streptomyces sp. EAG2]RZD87963.1 hypothetical protein C0Q63_10400 [Streptomyces albidoflavus]RZE04130.1 hypothetical protein C0Q64_09480 [Streptomyces albidoflavus]RZE04242.1 hypothetical protein C0Q65_09810 [Streptomyces albidoflavus]
MSDLTIDGTVFEGLRKTFTSVADRMDGARRALRNADGSVVGAEKLVDEVHDFAEEWGHGVKQLGKHTQGAVKIIDRIDREFTKLDQELAKALNSGKKDR